MSTYVKFTQKADIGFLKLNRSQKLNALSSKMIEDLMIALLDAEKNSRIKVIILYGTEKAFSAGGDIEEEKGMSSLDALRYNLHGQKLCSIIQFSEKPVIATISGYVLGGGLELALACDFRICSTSAIFGFPEVTLSVTTGWGGAISLIKMVGLNKAKEMLMLGKRISAKEALDIGIVNQVVETKDLLPASTELAEKLATIPSLSLALIKQSIHRYVNISQPNDLFLEAVANAFCYSLEDKRKAYKAFINRKLSKKEGKEEML
jgi:enoyl-CoA hydratase/carnithine racemase